MLNAASIIAEGEAITGIADAEPQLHGNLRVLVESLNKDARHSAEGHESCRQALLRVVKDRLLAQKWLRDFPEIGEEYSISSGKILFGDKCLVPLGIFTVTVVPMDSWLSKLIDPPCCFTSS